MRVFLISFELKNPVSQQNRNVIIDKIQSITGIWWNHLPDVWLIADKSDNWDSDMIYEEIKPFFKLDGANPEDLLFVSRINPMDSQGFLPKRAWDWIRKVTGRETLPLLDD